MKVNASSQPNHKLKTERIESYVGKVHAHCSFLSHQWTSTKEDALQDTFNNLWRNVVGTTGASLLANGGSRGRGRCQTRYDTRPFAAKTRLTQKVKITS